MADRPSARDEDRLPWLEPFGESEKKRARKPVSRTALVGLLVAFLGAGLAVAFSLGYRVARPSDAPSVVLVEPPQRTASVTTPLPPPAPEPRAEPTPPPVAAQAPVIATPIVAAVAKPVVAKPVVKKARAKAKKRYAKGSDPAPVQAGQAASAGGRTAAPREQPPMPPRVQGPTPRGRVIQLGAYSTQGRPMRLTGTSSGAIPISRPSRSSLTYSAGRGMRYYGCGSATETQRQSAVICQQLEAKAKAAS